jgi:hypothetical protein
VSAGGDVDRVARPRCGFQGADLPPRFLVGVSDIAQTALISIGIVVGPCTLSGFRLRYRHVV